MLQSWQNGYLYGEKIDEIAPPGFRHYPTEPIALGKLFFERALSLSYDPLVANKIMQKTLSNESALNYLNESVYNEVQRVLGISGNLDRKEAYIKTHQAEQKIIPVGILSQELLQKLKQEYNFVPKTSVISLSSSRIAHMTRSNKPVRYYEPVLQKLPEIFLKHTPAILKDNSVSRYETNPNINRFKLLYYVKYGNIKGKIILELNENIKEGERIASKKIYGNRLLTNYETTPSKMRTGINAGTYNLIIGEILFEE